MYVDIHAVAEFWYIRLRPQVLTGSFFIVGIVINLIHPTLLYRS